MLAVVLATAVTSALRLESLPRSFDKGAFESFASQRPSLLASRWGEFLQQMGPLSAEAARLFTTGRLRGDDAAYARATREALARLGPTFIKIGQILSVREDVLGPVWAAELAALQDGIEPVSSAEALAAIASSLGDEAFEHIEPQPVACASLAQVHRGVWRDADGTRRDVAIKLLTAWRRRADRHRSVRAAQSKRPICDVGTAHLPRLRD